MVEFDTSKIGYSLKLDGKYYNTLDIEGFSHMMKDPSYCYKFYWLEAIVQLIAEGVKETTFDAVIDEMICNAWYSVREFHIHLSGMPIDGQVKDGLERAVSKLSELSNLPANASKVEIKNAIKKYALELKTSKEQLTNMVPYRALAGFFDRAEEPADWGSVRRMTEYIERINEHVVILPYTLGTGSKLKKEIYFQPSWTKMIQDNTVSILGWIQYEKVKWLQNNNPEVPGLVYKLAPMDSSLNSAKSNKLPKWDPFFERFAENQYLLYGFIHEKPGIHKLFEGCYRDNLHSIWAGRELYCKGNSREQFYNILQKNMQPMYDSARRQGYEVWNRGM